MLLFVVEVKVDDKLLHQVTTRLALSFIIIIMTSILEDFGLPLEVDSGKIFFLFFNTNYIKPLKNICKKQQMRSGHEVASRAG